MTKPAGARLAVVVAALALAGACRDGFTGDAAVPDVTTTRVAPTTTTTEATTTTSTSTTTTTATTTPLAPGAAAAPPPPGLGRGSTGAEVVALEQRLDALHYDVGKIDGVFDSNTGHAVMAFQKVHGLPLTSRATQDVTDRLVAPTVPTPMVPGGGATKVEIDLKRQILLLWKDGALLKILPVSTGNNKRYCVEGECAVAVTPGGSFRVLRRISGWRESRLGKLYNPLYFNGGIAIHGSPSVPGYPASHGCVRIPMFSSGWFPQQVPNGTPVYVVGGRSAPVPFNEPVPGDPLATTTTAAAPGATTTTAPAESTTVPPSPGILPLTPSEPTTTTVAP